MKTVFIIVVLLEASLVFAAGWGVHTANASLRDMSVIGAAMCAVLLIVTGKHLRKKRSCCT